MTDVSTLYWEEVPPSALYSSPQLAAPSPTMVVCPSINYSFTSTYSSFPTVVVCPGVDYSFTSTYSTCPYCGGLYECLLKLHLD